MLTKSDYNKFLQCVKYLWLNKYRKDLAEEYSEQQQAIFTQGYEVEDYAHLLFPPGIETAQDLFESERDTIKLMANKTPVIYQATAVADYLGEKRFLLVRADIIVYNGKTKSYDLYEVKSTTKSKPEHLPDIAFQKLTFAKAGYPMGKTYLIHLNNEYERNGKIEPQKLLTIEDLTEIIDTIIPQIEAEIPKALAILKQKNEPEVRIIKQCGNPYECPFIPYCWEQAKIPEYSVYDLAGIHEKTLLQLLDKEIIQIKKIPDDIELTKAQTTQVEAEKKGAPIINKKQIDKILNALKYPLYFLDYETVAPAIPFWDGTNPYQQVCFQYSLHVLKNPGAPLQHYEFLSDGSQNPMPKLLEQMKRDFASHTDPENIKGTVIVWYKPFETSRNKEMAKTFPQYKKFLESVNRHVFDLMEIFKKLYYVHPGTHGSNSIKSVLPVLVPELSYKNLEIGEGGLASLKWLQMNFPKPAPAGADAAVAPLTSAQKYQTRRALLTYCGQDTLAMVKILAAIS